MLRILLQRFEKNNKNTSFDPIIDVSTVWKKMTIEELGNTSNIGLWGTANIFWKHFKICWQLYKCLITIISFILFVTELTGFYFLE